MPLSPFRRRQVIIREQLKFPSGFSTAVLISVLHGQTRDDARSADAKSVTAAGFASLAAPSAPPASSGDGEPPRNVEAWRRNVRLLLLCFLVSGVFTFATYFFPVLRNIPIFGSTAATTWLWTLNPSLAYVGQGIIMGPATTLHMLVGAVVGWGILSPLAKSKGWAPGPVDDWENGSKGWIVWTSLAIMLADAVVSLGFLAVRSARQHLPQVRDALRSRLVLVSGRRPRRLLGFRTSHAGYTSLNADADADGGDDDGGGGNGVFPPSRRLSDLSGDGDALLLDEAAKSERDDAPPDQQISDRVVTFGLVLSILFCILCTQVAFGNLVPLYATVTAVFMALVLSIMGVRALGETDLNPVSGISKLAQLFFALIIPQSNKSSVLINLVAGAVVC